MPLLTNIFSLSNDGNNGLLEQNITTLMNTHNAHKTVDKLNANHCIVYRYLFPFRVALQKSCCNIISILLFNWLQVKMQMKDRNSNYSILAPAINNLNKHRN